MSFINWSHVGKLDDEDLSIILHSKYEKINLSYNEITLEGFKVLAEFLKNNSSLKILKINNCYGKDAHDGLLLLYESLRENMTLSKLVCCNNTFTRESEAKLFEILKNINTLQCLDLFGNSMHNVKSMVDFLEMNSSLRVLKISNNFFQNNDIDLFLKSLKYNCNLEKLYFSNCQLGSSSSEILSESLKKNTTLKHLEICAWKINKKGGKFIAKSLIENNTLTHLNFGDNNMGFHGSLSVLNSLKNNQSLQYLNLYKNNIDITKINKFYYFEALEYNNSLRELCLSYNSIGNQGAKCLFKGLQHNTSIEKLDLTAIKIDHTVIEESLSNLLKNNKLSFRVLILKRNNIGNEGIKSLSNSLENNTTLLHLDLSENGINEAFTYFNCLQFNTSLQVLNLKKNDIYYNKKDQYLLNSLKVNNSLQTLNISNNHISDEQMKILFQSLKENQSLKTLKIYNNVITDKSAYFISECLLFNQTLQNIYISKSYFGDPFKKKGLSFILNSLKVNSTLLKMDLFKGIGEDNSIEIEISTEIFFNNHPEKFSNIIEAKNYKKILLLNNDSKKLLL